MGTYCVNFDSTSSASCSGLINAEVTSWAPELPTTVSLTSGCQHDQTQFALTLFNASTNLNIEINDIIVDGQGNPPGWGNEANSSGASAIIGKVSCYRTTSEVGGSVCPVLPLDSNSPLPSGVLVVTYPDDPGDGVLLFNTVSTNATGYMSTAAFMAGRTDTRFLGGRESSECQDIVLREGQSLFCVCTLSVNNVIEVADYVVKFVIDGAGYIAHVPAAHGNNPTFAIKNQSGSGKVVHISSLTLDYEAFHNRNPWTSSNALRDSGFEFVINLVKGSGVPVDCTPMDSSEPLPSTIKIYRDACGLPKALDTPYIRSAEYFQLPFMKIMRTNQNPLARTFLPNVCMPLAVGTKSCGIPRSLVIPPGMGLAYVPRYPECASFMPHNFSIVFSTVTRDSVGSGPSPIAHAYA